MGTFRFTLLAGTATIALACAPVVAPRGTDRVPPRITLTVLNAPGNPSFDTTDSPGSGMGACALARSFPAKLSFAASDDGGLATLTLTAFPGRIANVAVTPASAEARVAHDAATATDVLTVTFHPPAGHVQPNALVTLTVDGISALAAAALDAHGNRADLYQVDLRAREDGLRCGAGS